MVTISQAEANRRWAKVQTERQALEYVSWKLNCSRPELGRACGVLSDQRVLTSMTQE